MTVLLAASSAGLTNKPFDHWCSTAPRLKGPDPARRIFDLTNLLEQSFDTVVEEWWTIGKKLGAEPTGELAHAPACATNASDFGVMLAWSRLVQRWAGDTSRIAVLCDDPWLFRHLAQIPGVEPGALPPLVPLQLKLALRGFAARTKVALMSGWAAMPLRGQRTRYQTGAPAILVYGHPASEADGHDAYFGHLMDVVPTLVRVLHVDCGLSRARKLSVGGRSFSLHAWGNPLRALALPFVKWRPSAAARSGEYGWLVMRAAAMEGSTGQAAQIAWQRKCQRAWLRLARPAVVAWPWENHAWERDFVRAARLSGARTVGYQHSTVGRHELNYSPASNADGLQSVPDRIFVSGRAGCRALEKFGYAPDSLTDAGALRLPKTNGLRHDASGLIFVALPFDGRIAAAMIEAVRDLAHGKRRFVVKPHPMTPFKFADSPGVTRTNAALEAHHGLAAVIYTGTSVGLDAALAGIPTIRFQADGIIATDVMPEEIQVPTATANTLDGVLRNATVPQTLGTAAVFSTPDTKLWEDALSTALST